MTLHTLGPFSGVPDHFSIAKVLVSKFSHHCLISEEKGPFQLSQDGIGCI